MWPEEVWLSRTQLGGQSRPGKNVPLGQSSAEPSKPLFDRLQDPFPPLSTFRIRIATPREGVCPICPMHHFQSGARLDHSSAPRQPAHPLSASRAAERCVAPLARLGFPALATHTPNHDIEHVLTISFLSPHPTVPTALIPLHSSPGRYT